jgi:mannose-6-phosphate isomerase
MAARQIAPRFVERPWGRASLAPWFAEERGRTGEVWFETPELLIKFLFTTEALSVQVHPPDDYARVRENSNGKTEMWYVLDAEPEAKIALGFRQPVSRNQVRQAALDGSIEDLLEWHRAAPGDTFFTPAGSVHALGGGLTVLEIQQVSDVTYRLYDYGRGRPLHLDSGLEVITLGPHPGKSKPAPLNEPNAVRLAGCRYFVTELWTVEKRQAFPAGSILIGLEGKGTLAGQKILPGNVFHLQTAVELNPDEPMKLVRTYAPET